MSMDSKRTVLVTGASAGIGRALALEFARNGHDVILVARRLDALRELGRAIRERYGVKATEIPLDLSVRRAADELLVAVRQRDLAVDVLVNNAGVAESGPFAHGDADDLHRMLMLNVAALTLLSRTFLPGMLEQGWGRILNVASVAGFQPMPGIAGYAATKAYVLSLTEALSEELKGTGVRVGALCPGVTDTDMAAQLTEVVGELPDLPRLLMSNPEGVAREGVDACMRGDVIRVPGVANRIGTAWSQVQPRWLVRTLGGFVGRQLFSGR